MSWHSIRHYWRRLDPAHRLGREISPRQSHEQVLAQKIQKQMKPSSRTLVRRDLILGTGAALLSSAGSARAATPPFEVTAKLLEIPTKLPPDDLYDYAYVMRYQAQGGPLDKQFLLVAHYRPLQPRSRIKDKMKSQVGGKLRSFTPGEVHKLLLSPDLKEIWKGPLLDEYSATDRKSIRYWCLQADPA